MNTRWMHLRYSNYLTISIKAKLSLVGFKIKINLKFVIL
jgi:hypothetical protein